MLYKRSICLCEISARGRDINCQQEHGVGGCRVPCKGFNPGKVQPRPIHTLTAIFLLTEQLWEAGLKPHLHLSSSSAEAKARSGPEDRAATPERAVSILSAPAMADGRFPAPQDWGAGTEGDACLLQSGAKLPRVGRQRRRRVSASISKSNLG